jgi:peptidoglycan LD-endopeptidase CwlK
MDESRESPQDSIENHIAKSEHEVKEAMARIEELSQIQFVEGHEEEIGFFPKFENLPGNPILARFSYGVNAPNMSAVFFDPALGKDEGRAQGEKNTREFLESQGFTGPVLQVTGKFDVEKNSQLFEQIEEVDLDTLKVKQKVEGNMVFTRDANVTLMIKPADCPVAVIYCKDGNGHPLVAIDHAGRDAINAGMTRQGLMYLQDELGVDLSQAVIAVFPGVSKEHYFITNEPERRGSGISEYNWGEENIDPVDPSLTTDNERNNQKRQVGILSAFEMQAIQAGVKPENIQAIRVDTYEDAGRGRAYSRRYSGEHDDARSGGQIVAVQLKDDMVNREMEEVIVDSAMSREQALRQNPDSPAPQEVLDRQGLIGVEYYSFDTKLHRGQIVVDVDLVDDTKRVFDLIKRRRFPIQSVIPIADPRYNFDDGKSVYANNVSGFNYRFIAGTDRLSNHALGRAVDINPFINPYIRQDYRMPEGVDYDPKAVGAITEDGEIVELFKKLGWEWGGDWTDRKDYQHFQKTT